MPPTCEDLQKCEHLEAAIKETLQLHPPAMGRARDVSKFKETWNACSSKCDMLSVNAHVSQRHPSLWKEPDKFIPERFLDGRDGDANSKFFAFSQGSHDCIGKHFTFLEAKLALSALVS